jgi:2-polyprenyl-3-methyl-5-hydroxy-6-metoxy-1,4-benzoquinol methylase
MTSARCPICDTGGVVHQGTHPDFPGAGIYYCPDCTHWFAHPEPDSESLAAYYRDIYNPKRLRYLGEEYCIAMERRASAQLDFIVDHIISSDPSKSSLHGLKVLDLGCGIGALVAAFQRHGADATGYDSDSVAINMGRSRYNANIHLRTLENAIASQPLFDLVCLSHFVEHLPHLRHSLESILKLLRPNGYVFIEVPNCFGEKFQAKVDTEAHLEFFTPASMIRLLETLNAQGIACETCGPPKDEAYNLNGNPSYGWKNRHSFRLLKTTTQTLQHALGRIYRPASRARTIYDGYYDKYYPGKNVGLWLRCLACKREFKYDQARTKSSFATCS